MRIERKFGRRFAPDPRDKQYPMRAAMRAVRSTPRIWDIGPTLDQGSTPQCVAYSIAHWLACTPIVTIVQTPEYEQALYDRAQQIDEWPGEDYDGTSCRAGFKVLAEQGRIESYVWAQNEQDIWDFIGTTGPVEMGTNWYETMFDPDPDGFLRPAGAIAGGHAWLLYGTHPDGYYLMQNSWGRWGINGTGTAKISRVDLGRLLYEDGEAGAGSEIEIDPNNPPNPDNPGCLSRILGF